MSCIAMSTDHDITDHTPPTTFSDTPLTRLPVEPPLPGDELIAVYQSTRAANATRRPVHGIVDDLVPEETPEGHADYGVELDEVLDGRRVRVEASGWLRSLHGPEAYNNQVQTLGRLVWLVLGNPRTLHPPVDSFPALDDLRAHTDVTVVYYSDKSEGVTHKRGTVVAGEPLAQGVEGDGLDTHRFRLSLESSRNKGVVSVETTTGRITSNTGTRTLNLGHVLGIFVEQAAPDPERASPRFARVRSSGVTSAGDRRRR